MIKSCFLDQVSLLTMIPNFIIEKNLLKLWIVTHHICETTSVYTKAKIKKDTTRVIEKEITKRKTTNIKNNKITKTAGLLISNATTKLRSK